MTNKNESTEQVMGRYAEALESGPLQATVTPVEPKEENPGYQRTANITQQPVRRAPINQTSAATDQPIVAGPEFGMHKKTDKAIRIENEVARLGSHFIEVSTLPTQGKFYPDDLRISIRSAKGSEIKHWSTMDDSNMESVKSMWNYMIEKCVSVRSMSDPGYTWKDLTEQDQLYILLAIREITFINDDNNLFVTVGEGKEVPVTKEMVHYTEYPEWMMRYYSPEDKCFMFKTKDNVIPVYLPTFGVNEWLYSYADRKIKSGAEVDIDFLLYAPLLIKSHRGMDDNKYNDLMYFTSSHYKNEWALLAKIVDTLKEVAVPTISFTKEDGTEASIQLDNFLGGSKSIFSIPDPLSILC